MKWILICGATMAGLAAVAFLVGLYLPESHTASRTLRLRRTPEEVWRVITDYSSMPTWRTGLERIERLPDRNGNAVWKETQQGGSSLPLEDVEADPPRRLVRKIADPSLPFGGTWTYELSPAAAGTTLKITEDGVVRNPIFRLMSRFMDPSASLTGFLESLARKFGEEPRFE